MRIAIFQWEHSGQVHSVLLANYLSRAGHEVSLIEVEGVESISSVKLDDKVSHQRISVRNGTLLSLFICVLAKGTRFFFDGISSFNFYLNEFVFKSKLWAYDDFLSRIGAESDLCIGVEKGGLILASEIWRKYGKPYFYYSLELYTDEHEGVQISSRVQVLRKYEKQAHINARATIVQDPQRADVLYASNGLNKNEFLTLYVPVSLDIDPSQRKVSKISSHLTLMHFGMSRLTEDEFVTLSRNLPEGYRFHFHHLHVYKEKKLLEKYGLDNVDLSNDHLDDSGIMKLIASARTGLCWYWTNDENSRLTAFSSEKMARYMAQGIPVIVRAQSNFEVLFKQYRCGVSIRDISKISTAIEKIESQYSLYSDNARKAYERFYSFRNNFAEIERGLQSINIVTDGSPIE